MDDLTKIAGLKNVGDWKNIKIKLTSPGVLKEDWEQVYKDFLVARISSRYLMPINAISKISENDGKGFSIVAICCTMIEFFESLIKGYDFQKTNYVDHTGTLIRSVRNKNPVGLNNPLSVKEVFQDFLTQNNPFKIIFNDTLAGDFYYQVRCSILHQAATGTIWTVKNGKKTDPLVFQESAQKIVLNWLPFKNAFEEFLLNYKETLLADPTIQKNFIFKWDKICCL